MDFESLNRYEGKQVRIILNNNFWYKAKVLSVKEDSITFIELKGNTVSVHPSAIIMIEEVSNGH